MNMNMNDDIQAPRRSSDIEMACHPYELYEEDYINENETSEQSVSTSACSSLPFVSVCYKDGYKSSNTKIYDDELNHENRNLKDYDIKLFNAEILHDNDFTFDFYVFYTDNIFINFSFFTRLCILK